MTEATAREVEQDVNREVKVEEEQFSRVLIELGIVCNAFAAFFISMIGVPIAAEVFHAHEVNAVEVASLNFAIAFYARDASERISHSILCATKSAKTKVRRSK